MNTLLTQRPERLPIVQACQALSLNRSSVYAWRKSTNNDHLERRSRQRAVQPRALSEQERMAVIKTMQSDEHADQPPAQIYQRLLERQQYLCSVSTMHRLLRSQKQNGERRAQRPAQHHAVPRLLARAPHEVWTWDITNTSGAPWHLFIPVRGTGSV
jgi:putative transposase